jgi:uncharacterized repeat protein (TIGR03899 family)
MNANDILGFGKILPIEKLFELLSNSFGRVSKSYFDRIDIDTKAYEIKELAKARAEEINIIAKAVNENFQYTESIEFKENKLAITSPKVKQDQIQELPLIEDRTEERLDFQEVKKQKNIESVTSKAAKELKNEQPVTDEPVDEDWTNRFFRIVEDISNEEMQELWSKILAGEIKQPKTYSLRTLELIRNLSKTEANIFKKVANLAVKSNKVNYLFKGNDEDLLSKYDIGYSDIALLIEIGLIQPGDFVSYQVLQQPRDSKVVFTSGHTVIVAEIKANTPTILMPVDVFSNSGNELLNLVQSNPPFDYLKAIANSIKSQNVEVKYGHILSWNGDMITHTNPLQDF